MLSSFPYEVFLLEEEKNSSTKVKRFTKYKHFVSTLCNVMGKLSKYIEIVRRKLLCSPGGRGKRSREKGLFGGI